jgi:molecular chaperone DnaJ
VESTSRVKLKIPPGIDENSRLRSVGNGEAGVRGGPRGDLYIVIHVKEHPTFSREDANLFCEVPVPFAVAALGGEIKVPTLEGPMEVRIPSGTQSGTTLRQRGKGMPALNGGSRGDLLVRVTVSVPKELNSLQRKKLEEFAEAMGEDAGGSKTFFDRIKESFT